MAQVQEDVRQLLLSLAQGRVSCEKLLDLVAAMEARYDDALGIEYRELAQLARKGRAHAHCERDLWRWALRQDWRRVLPRVVSFKVPSLHAARGEREVSHGFLLPHLTPKAQPLIAFGFPRNIAK